MSRAQPWSFRTAGIVATLLVAFVLQVACQGVDQIDDIVQMYMSANNVPGLSIAFAVNERLVYTGAYGYLDKEAEELVTTQSRFRFASVSKPQTAIAVMYLVQKKLLNLSDRVFGEGAILGSKYGAGKYSQTIKEITVQHLLEHSSGFSNKDTDGDPIYNKDWLNQTRAQLIGTILDNYEPTSVPGAKFSYNNWGYIVLGRVIQEVTGQSYETFVQENIFKEVGATGLEIGSDVRKGDEAMYYNATGAIAEAPYQFSFARIDAAAGWIGTPSDVLRVATTVDGGEARPDLLDDNIREIMFQRSTAADSIYAKGWDTSLDANENIETASHTGSVPGTASHLYINFAKRISGAVVANTNIQKHASPMSALIKNIIDKVQDWPDQDLFQTLASSTKTSISKQVFSEGTDDEVIDPTLDKTLTKDAKTSTLAGAILIAIMAWCMFAMITIMVSRKSNKRRGHAAGSHRHLV